MPIRPLASLCTIGESHIASDRISFEKAYHLVLLAESLLNWYDQNHRELPWRISPRDAAKGIQPNPYHIWLSEVMLQQTVVETVKPYYLKFLELWPKIEMLAQAQEDEVMAAWAGLGYYSRARNLHRCAKIISEQYGGYFPSDKSELIKLPGIGDYTASAIASIAFGQTVTVVDGNIERVMARIGKITEPLPGAKKAILAEATRHTPAKRAGDYAQGLMDIGARICTPRNPKCDLCPLAPYCLALKDGMAENLPVKTAKPKKPIRKGAAFVAIRNSDQAIFLQKRPDEGLLGGMAQLPTTEWSSRKDGATDGAAAPFPGPWQEMGAVDHVFTHFKLTLTVHRAFFDDDVVSDHLNGWWSTDLDAEALPTLFLKALTRAIADPT